MGLHVEIQFDADIEAVWRQIERQRQRACAEQRVEVFEHLRLEAPGQCLAWQALHLTEIAQAHARQRRSDIGFQADTVDRQLPEVMLQSFAVRHHQAIVGVGQHPRRHRVRRGDDAVAKPQVLQFLAQASFKLRPGTE